MRFRVKAAHLDGTQYVDTIEGDSAVDVGSQLRSLGYSVTSIETIGPGAVARLFGRGSAEDLAAISQQLELFLRSRAALPAALRAVARDMRKGAFQAALHQAASQVDAGTPLHDALAAQPRHFPPLFRFIVAAGCAAGQLGSALLLLADYYQASARLRHKLIEAAIYPAILISVMVVLVVYAACFILPRFQIVYQSMGAEMPALARTVLHVVHHTGEWLPGVCLAVAGCAVLLWVLSGVPAIGYAMGRVRFSIPVLGGLTRAYVVAKLSAGLSLLLQSSVPAPQALRLLADMEPNRWVRRAVAELARRTEQGQTVSDAMAQAPAVLLPKTFLWIVASADGTAALAAATQRLSELYADLAKRRFGMIEVLLMPAVVFVLGLLTFFVAAVLLLPLLETLQML